MHWFEFIGQKYINNMAVAVASWANHECCMRASHCVWFVCRIVSEVGIVWLRHSPATKSLCVCPTAVFIFTRRLSLWHRLNSLWLLPAGSAPRAHSCSGVRQCVRVEMPIAPRNTKRNPIYKWQTILDVSRNSLPAATPEADYAVGLLIILFVAIPAMSTDAAHTYTQKAKSYLFQIYIK